MERLITWPRRPWTMSLDANGRFMLTIIGADLPKFAATALPVARKTTAVVAGASRCSARTQ